LVKYHWKLPEKENLSQNISQINNNRNKTGNKLMKARKLQIKDIETTITTTVIMIHFWNS
jgi:hypothetical protein